MIEAREIRIGNVYDRKHGKGWTRTIITEEIMGKIFTGSDNEYALNDFEPIPISHDELIILGFSQNDSSIYSHMDTIAVVFAPGGPTFDYALYIPKQGMRTAKYVHQLQTLLMALTGVVI